MYVCMYTHYTLYIYNIYRSALLLSYFQAKPSFLQQGSSFGRDLRWLAETLPGLMTRTTSGKDRTYHGNREPLLLGGWWGMFSDALLRSIKSIMPLKKWGDVWWWFTKSPPDCRLSMTRLIRSSLTFWLQDLPVVCQVLFSFDCTLSH